MVVEEVVDGIEEEELPMLLSACIVSIPTGKQRWLTDVEIDGRTVIESLYRNESRVLGTIPFVHHTK